MTKKNFLSIIFILISIFTLTTCSNGDTALNVMYIEPASLSQKELKITQLYGNHKASNIFDYSVNHHLQSIDVSLYRLENSEWNEDIVGAGSAFTDSKGRIALDYDKLEEGISVAIQGKDSSNLTAYKRDFNVNTADNMAFATSVLTDRVPVEYEKQIPLVIQVMTSKNEIHTFDVSADIFEHPEKFAQENYDAVYLVTIKFSQSPLE